MSEHAPGPGAVPGAPALRGRTVVLIGGGSDIGLRVAHQVVAAGAEVVLGGRTAQRLAAAAPMPAVDGSVVLMSGAAGARPPAPAPAYAACNAAIEGLGRGLAVEPAPARGHPKSLEKSSSALRSVSEYQLPLSSRKIASMPYGRSFGSWTNSTPRARNLS